MHVMLCHYNVGGTTTFVVLVISAFIFLVTLLGVNRTCPSSTVELSVLGLHEISGLCNQWHVERWRLPW